MKIAKADLDVLREVLSDRTWKARTDALLRRARRILRVENGSIMLGEDGELSWSSTRGAYVVAKIPNGGGLATMEELDKKLLPAVLSVWLAVRAGSLPLDDELVADLAEIEKGKLASGS